MQFDNLVDDRDRLARILLSAVLALVAVSSLRKKRRLMGLLAGIGAVGLGYTATVGSDDSADDDAQVEDGSESASETETASEEDGMHCSVCSEPILVGQSRRPNADNVIVHDGCL